VVVVGMGPDDDGEPRPLWEKRCPGELLNERRELAGPRDVDDDAAANPPGLGEEDELQVTVAVSRIGGG